MEANEKNFAEVLDEKGYSDRPDVSADISLYEYLMMRNPDNDVVVYAEYKEDDETNDDRHFGWSVIGLDDVIEFLLDADDGFFSFVGSTKAKEIKSIILYPRGLENTINAANSWNGWFNESIFYTTKETVLEQIDNYLKK